MSMIKSSGLTFITGGARSGKSSFAEELALSSGKKRVYIATMQGLDGELIERIKKHKKQRGKGWRTVEEPLNIFRVLKKENKTENIILIDCLTLWVTNRMMNGGKEKEILKAAEEVAEFSACAKAAVIVVSNEVGMGLVPDNKLGRDFRDIQGRVNCIFAKYAKKVFFMTAGLPLEVK